VTQAADLLTLPQPGGALPPMSPGTAGQAASIGYEDLTAEQRQVVDATEATLLVGGGAGTGKTTTALWAARVQLTRPSTPASKRVLFLTFSRTAVAQILSRARRVLVGIGDRVEILTFDGLAYRLLCQFGRYAGGPTVPLLRGESEAKLALAADSDGMLTYEELLPLALELLAPGSPVRELLLDRWSMVICDEFQDTDEEQWKLLELLGERARLVLLADPNQMIYGWRRGVDETRLEAARARPRVRELLLPAASHRDPTQVLPTAAEDTRRRRFDTPNVQRAVQTGRLVVHADIDAAIRHQVVADQLVALQATGHATVGVFARTNARTADLSAALTGLGVEHVPIGFPEAYGEALSAMATMAAYTAGQAAWDQVTLRLAVFLTATDRAREPPALALGLVGRAALPPTFADRVEELRGALSDATDPLGEGAEVARAAWSALGVTTGYRPWTRAAATFAALAARAQLLPDAAAALERVQADVRALRNASMVQLDAGDIGAVQVMNFSQTKGREADATLLVFEDDDFFGHEAQPYPEASRLLYVAMTRARKRVVVLLPPRPHALVAPLNRFATPLPAPVG
jgi:DNA helicase II / ATP-dependent DNA helicase PcrA